MFLRVLEYYSGILFLTTNRVGILDEAFKSRIHISLHYRHLSKEQTLAIFDVNIRKLHEIEKEKQRLQAENPGIPQRPALEINAPSIRHYAEWHYDNHEDHRWNGRQIRNAFQIAYSLAHFDMQKTSLDTWDENTEEPGDDVNPDCDVSHGDVTTKKKPVLDYQQFRLVADTIRRFDNYLFETLGETDTEQALNWSLRADEHDPDDWDSGPVYRPAPIRNQRQSYAYNTRGSSQGRGQPRGGSSRGGVPRGGYGGQGGPSRARVPAPAPEYEPPSKTSMGPRQKPQGTPQREPGYPPAARPSPARGTHTPGPPGPPKRRSDQGYFGWSTDFHSPGRATAAEEDYVAEGYEEEVYEDYAGYENGMDDHDEPYDENIR